MAQFYGTIQGSRGRASRLGTKTSGLQTIAASWEGAVMVELYRNESTGMDMCHVYLIPWHGVTRKLYSGPVSGDVLGQPRQCWADGCTNSVPANQGSDYCGDCLRGDAEPLTCDICGRTCECSRCRTCGVEYADGGDGFDGECPNCADKRPVYTAESFDAFTRAYIEALLWTNDPTPGSGEWDRWDETFPLLSAEDIETAMKDCQAFQSAHADLLSKAGTAEQNGHDFYLTRNRHGAGFWDRGYAPEVGRALTEAAHAFGSHDGMLSEAV